MENQKYPKSITTVRYNKYFFEEISDVDNKEGFVEKVFKFDINGNPIEEE